MRSFFSNKAVRFLLSLSVSIWMAGGCLFGCSNATMGAVVAEDDESVVAAGESCHARAAHDCCSKAKPEKVAKKVPLLSETTAMVPKSRGEMKDCPLMMSATAVAVKGSTHLPDPGSSPISVLPSFERQTAFLDPINVVPFLPNRGPTHLRCCVFLI